MSMKHFRKYYAELEKNYCEMLSGLKQLEQDCTSGMVPPERVENFMKTMQPIKDSFFAVQYIKYLIDKPNKKDKLERYERQFKSIDKEHYIEQPKRDMENFREQV